MKRTLIMAGVTAGLLGLGFMLAFWAYTGLRIPCIFYELTKLQCPGCGNTRATIALLRLDFKAMFGYNLLYPLEMLYILRIYLVCAINYIRGGRFAYRVKPDWIDIICLVLFVVWAIVRNCIPQF